MRVQVQKCRTCGKLGVGPNKIKLLPFEGYLYCPEDFRAALEWHEQRSCVTGGIERTKDFYQDALRPPRVPRPLHRDWRGYLQECSEMAAWGLLRDDRKTFVHYFARALYAWELKEDKT